MYFLLHFIPMDPFKCYALHRLGLIWIYVTPRRWCEVIGGGDGTAECLPAIEDREREEGQFSQSCADAGKDHS